jgi:DNA sulfur modification protein DndE
VIETVRVSKQAKDQLLALKRRTGIMHWNVLCRWALMRSLAEPSPPPQVEISTHSNVEMTWKVFAGAHPEVLAGLMRMRCAADGHAIDDESLAEQFRLHLHRGIGYLYGDREIDSVDALIALAAEGAEPSLS